MEGDVLSGRALRLSAIKAFVLSEISNPALCLADVAAHAQISTSYVRKLFATEGARFSAFVLGIRLELVAKALTDPETRLAPISVVALRYGFNDISYFNRAFRRRYGCTPSDLRAGRCDPMTSES